MKKFLSFLAVSTLLTGCSLPFFGDKVSVNPKNGDTITAHYVGTFDDGTVFESSRQEGRTPMKFVLGSGGLLKPFEDAFRDMKVGDKKKIRIEAKDAYGEEFITNTYPATDFRETVTQKTTADVLTGIMELKYPLAQTKTLFPDLKVGSEIKKDGGASLKVLSIKGDEVLLSIVEPKAIFYGKKLVVGLTGISEDGQEMVITKIEGKDVTVDIKKKQEIISKNETEVVVKERNPHPLAGKALNFEVELVSFLGATVK